MEYLKRSRTPGVPLGQPHLRVGGRPSNALIILRAMAEEGVEPTAKFALRESREPRASRGAMWHDEWKRPLERRVIRCGPVGGVGYLSGLAWTLGGIHAAETGIHLFSGKLHLK